MHNNDLHLMDTLHFVPSTCTTLARVIPKVVTASAQALNANVQWSFGQNVEDRIKTFIVEVTPDGGGGRVDVPAPARVHRKERFATFSSLKPNTTYHLKIIAEYKDSARAESEEFTFTTSGTLFLTFCYCYDEMYVLFRSQLSSKYQVHTTLSGVTGGHCGMVFSRGYF